MRFGDRLQGLLNGLNEGAGLLLMRGLVFVILFGSLMGFYAFKQFRGLRRADAMEAAQVARHLAEGKGFRTQCLRPADIGFLDKRDLAAPANGVPDIRHAPVFPGVLALGFRLAGPSFEVKPESGVFEPEARVIVPLGFFFSLATALLLYVAGTRLFDRRVGVVGVFLFLLTETVLDDSISGTALPIMTFMATGALTTAVFTGLHLSEGRSVARGLLSCTACALFTGLAVLTGYSLAVLLPVVLLFFAVGLPRARRRTAILFIVTVGLVVTPWFVRNVRVSGNPFGAAPLRALEDTWLHEGDTVHRTTAPDLDSARVSRALKTKLLRRLAELYDGRLRTLGSGLVICFFLVAIFHRFDREVVNIFKWCLVALILLLLLVCGLSGTGSGRVLHVLLPVAVLYGTAFFFVMLDRAENLEAGWQTLLTWLLVGLTAAPMALTLVGPGRGIPYPPYYPPFAATVCQWLEPEEVLCADIPWATAWYGRRTSVLLPATVEEFMAIHRTSLPMSGLYLTTETANRPYYDSLVAGRYASWRPVLERRVPEAFPFHEGIALPPDRRDQLFLTDRVRWTPRRDSPLAEDRDEEIGLHATETR